MATSKERIGETPNGGVKSVLYYQDKNGNLVEEDVATHATIVEFDSEGNNIFRTYMVLGNKTNE